jgi:hypothetical protein
MTLQREGKRGLGERIEVDNTTHVRGRNRVGYYSMCFGPLSCSDNQHIGESATANCGGYQGLE